MKDPHQSQKEPLTPRSFDATMTKTSLTPRGVIQMVHFPHFCPVYPRDEHLGNSVSPGDREGPLPPVDHDQAYLSPVIRVNGPRRIDHPYAVLQGETAPWPYLCLISLRDCHGYPRRDKPYFSRIQCHRSRNCRPEIHPRGPLRFIGWQRYVFPGSKSLYPYFQPLQGLLSLTLSIRASNRWARCHPQEGVFYWGIRAKSGLAFIKIEGIPGPSPLSQRARVLQERHCRL